ncbi:MAG: pilus assembly protein [Rhodopseudomonas sp.]|nr:pilus assembly protein [Rhodopseudomonas sp.]
MTATHRKSNLLRRFAGDRRGVSAVEFALLAPVMIGLYLGSVEISDGVGASRKVSLTAAALANLTAQVSTISASDMSNILNASSAIISPYDASKLKITVSCLSVDKNNAVTVKWTATRNGGVGGAATVPAALTADYTATKTKTYPVYFIYSQVSYSYTPTVGYTITGSINLSDKMYMSPRLTPPTYGSIACT